MELSQLRTFRVVAETLNFTRAAERLGLTQSAVSHQIKSLETELGEPLFIRAKRGVKLSPAGQAALENAVRILDEAEALRERVSGGEHSPAGRVRAAAATQAFVHLFAPLFEGFMREQPRIDVSFRTTASTDQTVSEILNGVADVGFASLPVFSPALKITSLFEDELVLVVGHGHRFAGKADVTLEEVKDERMILFELGGSIRRATDEFFNKVGFQPALALESNDTSFIKLMVERGQGISLLPAWAVRDEVSWGWLSKVRIEGHELKRMVAVISLARFQPAATRAFLEFMLARREEIQALAQGEPQPDDSRPGAGPGAGRRRR
jgi:DNA-binding transcriptional LysR family regulator